MAPRHFPLSIHELDVGIRVWRENIIATLKGLEHPTLIFSHFMVINCVVGWVQGKEKLVSFTPGYCSVHSFEKVGEYIKLIDLGTDSETFVH